MNYDNVKVGDPAYAEKRKKLHAALRAYESGKNKAVHDYDLGPGRRLWNKYLKAHKELHQK